VPPATKLESIETNIGVVIIKAGSEMGSVAVNTGAVSVRAREVTDSSTGHKEQGLAIDVTPKGQPKDTMLIDYDEIAALVSGIDSLSKLNLSVTALNAFDAAYTTRGGFRISALGIKRTGAIQFSFREARVGSPPVLLSRDEMFRFLVLINQAKSTLDSLRGGG
jgi:hypothetical protein